MAAKASAEVIFITALFTGAVIAQARSEGAVLPGQQL
jgi:hypothetical protein